MRPSRGAPGDAALLPLLALLPSWLLPVLLVLAGAWLGLALAIELLAWWGHGLGDVGPPPAFRAPIDAHGASATLCFLGDLQRGVSDVAGPLARALRARPADVLVSSGDLVGHGEAPYYGVMLAAFTRADVPGPIRAVPGNHDLQARGRRDPTIGYRLWRTRIGPPWWSERVGPVLLVGLDESVGGVEGEQLAWLRRTLAEREGVPYLVVCHRPPRRVDEEAAAVEPDLAELVALLEADPPRLLVCGHQHASLDRTVAGVRYVVNAHGGDVHGLALRRDPFELLRVRAGADGTLDVETTRHRRRSSPRAYLDQLAVRCWWMRRRGGGRLVTQPVAWLLTALGARAPLEHAG